MSSTSKSEQTCPEAEEQMVELALDYMVSRGWIDAECADEVEPDLRRLYRADTTGLIRRPEPIKLTGDLMTDLCLARPREYLAHAWECEQIEEYERSVPIWECACGSEFKNDPGRWGSKPNNRFYRIAEDDTFGELVGTLRGHGSGKEERNDACPDCGRRFAETIQRQLDPQLSLFG